ncbi:isochorismate synthase [Lysinibacillus pakistanensis]|uniref:isochorismate synthase n=1 Tax=Lysinibacillus pakistanensis TaxID=759811 RepID=A0ABX6D9T4_9BACI|nr:isochorismate synthase [Lysinibacillus pakistanensis]
MENMKLSDILNHFSNNDTFLKTPERLLVFNGEQTRFQLAMNDSITLIEEIRAIQKEFKAPIIIGAIPFDQRSKATIIIPDTFVNYHHSNLIDDLQTANQPLSIEDSIDLPSRLQFNDMVQEAIHSIRKQQFSKVVLARSLKFHLQEEPPIKAWLTNLLHKNKQGYIFSIALDNAQNLIGASPELLVKKEGNIVTINPLAGSRKKTYDLVKDKAIENELLHAEKDLHEHKIVVDYICEKLDPYLAEIECNEKPAILYTDTMMHLSTVIKGKIKNDTTTVLDVAQLLHPTPAICGAPQKPSLEFIQKMEPFNRGYYTGIVGYMDQNGDGEWVITIRCAEINHKAITLFAGAGIVNSSQQDSEYNEISAKFTTMLQAMGLAQE